MGFFLMIAVFLFIMLVVAPYFVKYIKNQQSFVFYLYYFVMFAVAIITITLIGEIFEVPTDY